MRVDSGGLVLLHPFLVKLFIELNLVKDGGFISLYSRERAVGVLNYIASGQETFNNQQAHLAKLLCGIDIDESLVNQYPIDDGVKKEVGSLLEAVIDNWPTLKNTSPDSFRDTFLKREAELIVEADSARLMVERITIDVLLDKLPWDISIVRLPFQKTSIMVEWL